MSLYSRGPALDNLRKSFPFFKVDKIRDDDKHIHNNKKMLRTIYGRICDYPHFFYILSFRRNETCAF